MTRLPTAAALALALAGACASDPTAPTAARTAPSAARAGASCTVAMKPGSMKVPAWYYSQGFSTNAVLPATWTTSDTTVAIVYQNGSIATRAPGVATVRVVDARGCVGTGTLTVEEGGSIPGR